MKGQPQPTTHCLRQHGTERSTAPQSSCDNVLDNTAVPESCDPGIVMPVNLLVLKSVARVLIQQLNP